MKIANWNLERVLPSQRRLSVIQEYLSLTNADLWFLTETHEDVVPDERLFSVVSGEPDRPSRTAERWVAIWSRWPMESLANFVSDSSRCAAARIPTSPFGELVLYGTVLPWNNEWHGIPAVDGQAFEAALSIQKKDWLRLRKEFPNATLIVAGDFNQDLASQHYYGSQKKRNLLERALDETGLFPLTGGSSDPIARDSPPYACIDHICISKGMGWKLANTRRWPETSAPVKRLSDHFGLSVELHR